VKNIFNVLVFDGQNEWLIAHAYMPKIEAKNTQAMFKIISSAIDLVKESQSDPSTPSTPVPPPSQSPSSSSSSSTLPVPAATFYSLSCQAQSVPSPPPAVYQRNSIATITLDGAPVNKAALNLLSIHMPQIIGFTCSAHGLNLCMKHLVLKTKWMTDTTHDALKVIKFFKNRQRPREILALVYPKQLKLPPITRFAYTLLALQSLAESSSALKEIARSSMTDECDRTRIQTEWTNLRRESYPNDLRKMSAVETIISSAAFYSRVDSLIKFLTPIYNLLRLFDKAGPGQAGWLFSSLLHLRKSLQDILKEEYERLQIFGCTEVLALVDKRLRYLATPAVLLAFFLNPIAVSHTPPSLLEGFWTNITSGVKEQSSHTFKQAEIFYESLFTKAQETVKEQASKDLKNFHAYFLNPQAKPLGDPEFERMFPILANIRDQVIGSPAVSSGSERGFSTTRRIESADRNRMSERTTEMLTFINLNMRPKTPKIPMKWEDIQVALNPNTRVLDEPFSSPESLPTSDRGDTQLDSEEDIPDFESDTPGRFIDAPRPLNESPDNTLTASNIFISNEVEFVSPLLATSSFSSVSFTILPQIPSD